MGSIQYLKHITPFYSLFWVLFLKRPSHLHTLSSFITDKTGSNKQGFTIYLLLLTHALNIFTSSHLEL